MGKRVSAYLENRQQNGIESMVKDDAADNPSEAVRMALDAGLAQLGYGNGQPTPSRLQWAIRELAKVFGYMGIGWLGLTMLYPLEFRIGAVVFILGSLACLSADKLLDQHYPAIAGVLGRNGRGEKA